MLRLPDGGNGFGNVTQILALDKSSVNLPCDISVPNNRERVTLILWYREDAGVPIYRYVNQFFLIHEAGNDHYFYTCRTFQNLANQLNIQVRRVITTGGIVGLAEWIIDGKHVLFFFFHEA